MPYKPRRIGYSNQINLEDAVDYGTAVMRKKQRNTVIMPGISCNAKCCTVRNFLAILIPPRAVQSHATGKTGYDRTVNTAEIESRVEREVGVRPYRDAVRSIR